MIINGCRWQNHGQNHGQNYMATFWEFRKWHAIKLKRWGRGKRASITLVLKEGSRLGRILKDPTCSKAGGLITDSGWENLLRNDMPFCEVVSFCRQDFLSIYPFSFVLLLEGKKAEFQSPVRHPTRSYWSLISPKLDAYDRHQLLDLRTAHSKILGEEASLAPWNLTDKNSKSIEHVKWSKIM